MSGGIRKFTGVGSEFLNWAVAQSLPEPIFPLQEYERDRSGRPARCCRSEPCDQMDLPRQRMPSK